MALESDDWIAQEKERPSIDDGIHLIDEESSLSSSKSSESGVQSSPDHEISDADDNEEEDDETYYQDYLRPELTEDEDGEDEPWNTEDHVTWKQNKLIWDLEETPYHRVKRSNKKVKAQKQVKDKHAKSIRLNSLHRPLYIHHRLYKRVQLDPPSDHYLPSNRPAFIFKPDSSPPPAPTPRRPVAPAPVIPQQLQPYTLTEQTRSQQAEFDDATIALLMELQNRDLSPEDYELLLRLDERVQRKTVNTSVLRDLPTINATDQHLDDLCSICMENYTRGQILKQLPCSHLFHSSCIERYLKEFSVQCPLDNLPLQ